MSKRILDLSLALLALALASPLWLGVALAVALIDGAPVLHRATRVGAGGRLFTMYKFRTMVRWAADAGPAVTMGDDLRITALGRVLRGSKLDELPQLLNVVRGDMSLVGPRPEDPRFVASYTPEQRRVLTLRPGITSPASLAFRDEQALLAGGTEADYVERVLPAKLALELEYLAGRSLALDVAVLLRTLAALPPLTGAALAVRRHVPWMAVDAATVLLAFHAALALRFIDSGGRDPSGSGHALDLAVLPLALLWVTVNGAWRLNRRVWSFAAAGEVVLVFGASAMSAAAALAADVVAGVALGVRPLPVSVVVLGGFLTFTGIVCTRYRARLLRAVLRSSAVAGVVPRRAVVYGAGDAGQFVAWRLLSQPEGRAYRLVGFLDDDRAKRGLRIHGLPVLGGRDELESVVRSHRVDLVIVAISNVRGDQMRGILAACQRTDAQIKTIPNLFSLMSEAAAPLLREVRLQDLLGRPEAMHDGAACRELLEDRAVLVTGACGSVGAELCRQIARFRPARLVALDVNESGLYDLAIELRALSPSLDLRLVVGDVANAAKVEATFGRWPPDVVFHAAAYKHVPLMEEYPEEAARVNVEGTRVVLETALRAGAGRFVMVSTDKAVNPSSAMGASKRVGELLVLARGRSTAEDGGTLCTAVRFGNVLGSRGSVVPTFARQIQLGGPVTVTDAGMTRYFMEVSEAASLILQAATLTRGGDIFMLEMGERVRIDDLARKMIRIRGLRPCVDIPIVYTGIRPGEKLHEDLVLAGEVAEPTEHPLIYRLHSPATISERRLGQGIDRLLRTAAAVDRAQVTAALLALSRGEGVAEPDTVELVAVGEAD